MYYYPMKALTCDRRELFKFTLDDGPCPINNTSFVLQNKPNTPILLYSDIYHWTGVADIYEGDIVQYFNTLYSVCYRQGFYLSNGKQILKMPVKDLTVVNHVCLSDNKYAFIHRNKNLYRNKETNWSLKDQFGSDDYGIWINWKQGMLVPYNEIQQYAGVSYSKMLYFGDDILGGKLTLLDGRCCVNNADILISIKERNQ